MIHFHFKSDSQPLLKKRVISSTTKMILAIEDVTSAIIIKWS